MARLVSYLLALVLFCPLALFAADSYTVDDFEDLNFQYNNDKKMAWFVFGNSSQKAESVADTVANRYSAEAGKYYVHVTGSTDEWYVGGIGKTVNQDITKFSHVKLLVYGNGKNRGKFAIEMYDDDNNNDTLEMDKDYIALKDDKWVFELDVNWEGWRVITIPFADFKDDNPGVGDDVFNPSDESGSAGLLNFQLIFLTQEKTGQVDIGFDSIQLVDANNVSSRLLIDDFEDGSLENDFGRVESWWTFGDLTFKVDEDKSMDALAKYTGKGVLGLTGSTSKWYVGGFGKYLAIDGSDFGQVKLMVRGSGKDSGTLQIELYDDDNNNKELEQDAEFLPIYDDKWTASLPVTWEGWKVVTVPFYRFKDANKNKGDNIFNLDTKNGSGGLLHMQFIVNATKEKGAVDLALDNIKLVK